jgi:LDH2 family malate/lactate/ureidoglycolate dehydrogenase
MPTFSAEALCRVAQTILQALGTPSDIAQLVGDSLVQANSVGHDSHGVIRLEQYARFVRQGHLHPQVRPQVSARRQANAQVDAAHGWGQPAARLASQTAIELASESGVAAVTIVRCGHVGRLGEYVELIANAGLIGMALCNAGPAVAPYGGYKPLIGTNPIAWAVPRGAGQPPLIVDFATAGVAEGKLRVSRAKGERVAAGLVVDSEGRPSQDPAAFYAGGALLPFGGHKGYGISVMIELLGGALSGNGTSALSGQSGSNGTLLLALKIEAFVPVEQFLEQTNELCEQIKASPPAEGFDEILLPGEPEIRERKRRQEAGISIPDQTWREIQALAVELNVTV